MISNSPPNIIAILLIINRKCYLMQHQSSTAQFSPSPTANVHQIMLASSTARLQTNIGKSDGNNVLTDERLNSSNDGDVEIEQTWIVARMIPIILSDKNCALLTICAAAAEVNEVGSGAEVEARKIKG